MGLPDHERIRALAQLSPSDIGESEENVKQKFLVPLLETLGHDRQSLDFERTITVGRVDVFIKGLRKDCTTFAETKAYGADLNRHLSQLHNYTSCLAATIAVITNGDEVRLYSPLRGVPFDRFPLYSIRREKLDSEQALHIFDNFLSRMSLTGDGQAHSHIETREKELRRACTEIDEVEEKYRDLRAEINADIENLERDIEGKRKELSELEARRQSEVTTIWEKLGLEPIAELPIPPPRPGRPSPPHEKETIDWESLILQTLS